MKEEILYTSGVFYNLNIIFNYFVFPKTQKIDFGIIECLIYIYIVRLSLLTMTNPNQLCDVLLFVCSKMADETNLSSKLPVVDRTREV